MITIKVDTNKVIQRLVKLDNKVLTGAQKSVRDATSYAVRTAKMLAPKDTNLLMNSIDFIFGANKNKPKGKIFFTDMNYGVRGPKTMLKTTNDVAWAMTNTPNKFNSWRITNTQFFKQTYKWTSNKFRNLVKVEIQHALK